MAKLTKRQKAIAEKVEAGKHYAAEEAFQILKKMYRLLNLLNQ